MNERMNAAQKLRWIERIAVKGHLTYAQFCLYFYINSIVKFKMRF